MTTFLLQAANLRPLRLVSMALLAVAALLSGPRPALAHEISPAIARMEEAPGVLAFEVAANIEAFVAGIDLAGLTDTSEAEGDGGYDDLRLLGPEEMAARFEAYWPQMAEGIVVRADGTPLALTLTGVEVPEVGDPEVARTSVFSFTAALPRGGAEAVEVGWAPRFGDLVLRQEGVEAPYSGYLEPGLISPPIPLSGAGGLAALGQGVLAGIAAVIPGSPEVALAGLGLWLMAPGGLALARLAGAAGAGLALGFAGAALAGVALPAPAAAIGGALAVIWAGAEAMVGPAEGRAARLPLAGAAGLVLGLVLASDPGLGGGWPAILGQTLGLLIAGAAVLAASYVATTPLRQARTHPSPGPALAAVALGIGLPVLAWALSDAATTRLAAGAGLVLIACAVPLGLGRERVARAQARVALGGLIVLGGILGGLAAALT